MITLYTLKPKFQALPRPLVGRIAAAGITANQVTIAAQDPISKIPEYKVCAVRLRKTEEPEYVKLLESQQ